LTANNFTNIELKFRVQYASVKITFTNFHLFKVKLHVYEVQTKELEDDKFTDDYVDAMSATNFNQTGLSSANPSSLFIKPTMIAGLKNRYKITTKTMILEPAQQYVHFMSQSSFMYNMKNYYDGTTLQEFAPFSRQVVYAYEPMFGPIFDSATAGVLKTGRVYTTGTATNNTGKMGIIAVEVNEKYVIDAPPDTIGSRDKDIFSLFEGYEGITTPTGNLQIYKNVDSSATSTYVPA
uniref:hypothetical protein n=1 Tax=Polynucleobacter sp. TaxID=2029855 RepID=UPI004048B11E